MTDEERNEKILERLPIIEKIAVAIACAAKRYLAYDFINDTVLYLCTPQGAKLLTKPAGYFTAAIRHYCIDMLKDKRYCYSWNARFQHILIEYTEEDEKEWDIVPDTDVEEDWNTNVMLEQIRNLVSERDWQVITYKERGYSQPEMAKHLGYTNGSTISKRRSLLYQRVQEEMQKPIRDREFIVIPTR